MKDDPKHISQELNELKLKETYLEVINSFAVVLFEAQSIEEIVWAVAKHAIAKLGYYDCVIYLYDDEKGKLIQSAAYGPKNPKKNLIKAPIEITPGQGIVGKVFETGIGEIVGDTSKDPRYLVDDEARLSEITIPLQYKDNIVGVIDSEHPDKNFFNEQDFKMLTTVAAMVSTKLAQAKVTNELKEYQKDLERRVSEKTVALEKSNALLTKQNKEKELLLKEIHHRVKNNMQIMISLLNLQITTSESEHERIILRDFQDRIRSMAIIHERLYLEKDMSTISIDQYIQELSNSLLSSFDQEKQVDIIMDIQPIHLDLDTAIPLGLLINELITNSLKHAFNDQENPLITIRLKLGDAGAVFEYTDNGTGFDPDERMTGAFGLDLIEILAEQIGTELTISEKNGCFCSFVLNAAGLH